MTDVFVPPVVDCVRLRLRPVRPEDATYIYGLRMNPDYNRHLSEVTGTVADQRAWIERYKAREAQGQEIYYIIERLGDGVPCGTVRLYDIAADSFTWGSWILDENKTPKAALESAVLVYVVAFDRLGCSRALFDVRRDNSRTLDFHRRFGARETRYDDLNVYFEYPRAHFEADQDGYISILKLEAET
ncbi:GNAT family N-acetyltransferase [Roseovarius sp. A21]|uniref:GNAT family N-acetyltransferase n=1 Tax=Roseovarius bejariae TaxID=2576383 RepID=A0A844CQC8_9RHOB|nr:GNAT family N-acetyltransferase [Roseovarius bejariae]MRU15675.1 GNAT family N-acetyltransferase [Roseovarius bejariae]